MGDRARWSKNTPPGPVLATGLMRFHLEKKSGVKLVLEAFFGNGDIFGNGVTLTQLPPNFRSVTYWVQRHVVLSDKKR